MSDAARDRAERVPTTEEVRAFYVAGIPPHRASVSQGNTEFDRWLAQVKAEALRDAAEALETVTVHWSNDGENTRAAWLRRRADEIEDTP